MLTPGNIDCNILLGMQPLDSALRNQPKNLLTNAHFVVGKFDHRPNQIICYSQYLKILDFKRVGKKCNKFSSDSTNSLEVKRVG